MKKARDRAFLDYDVLEAAYCACDRINAKHGINAAVTAAGAALRTVMDIEAGRGAAGDELTAQGRPAATSPAMPHT